MIFSAVGARVGRALTAASSEPEHELRVLTRGSSIVVDSVAILNAKATDAVTGGWSSTILQHADDDEPLPGEDQEGCDSDEWD